MDDDQLEAQGQAVLDAGNAFLQGYVESKPEHARVVQNLSDELKRARTSSAAAQGQVEASVNNGYGTDDSPSSDDAEYDVTAISSASPSSSDSEEKPSQGNVTPRMSASAWRKISSSDGSGRSSPDQAKKIRRTRRRRSTVSRGPSPPPVAGQNRDAPADEVPEPSGEGEGALVADGPSDALETSEPAPDGSSPEASAKPNVTAWEHIRNAAMGLYRKIASGVVAASNAILNGLSFIMNELARLGGLVWNGVCSALHAAYKLITNPTVLKVLCMMVLVSILGYGVYRCGVNPGSVLPAGTILGAVATMETSK